MPSRFPPWLSKALQPSENILRTREMLAGLGLNTVCQSARCPNLGECFARSTATFMILGKVCTRGCRFCAVQSGVPEPVDAGEPGRVAEAAEKLGLKHVVLTSVTRDDLKDGGVGQFAASIKAVRALLPHTTIEILTPDFGGDQSSWRQVAVERPDIFNHNVETVPRLYPHVRPGAEYERSLELLAFVKEMAPEIHTKSGIMVGLGERVEEVLTLMGDLRRVGCDIITIGQYLQPSKEHLAVEEFVPPEVFLSYEQEAKAMGFLFVASGPFVRSSYHAADFFTQNPNGWEPGDAGVHHMILE